MSFEVSGFEEFDPYAERKLKSKKILFKQLLYSAYCVIIIKVIAICKYKYRKVSGNERFFILEILARNEMQNVYTPLPLNIHFVFCLIATAIYLVQFYRKGAVHYILLMFAVDATFITQFWTTHFAISALAVTEAALLIAAAVLSHRYTKALREVIRQQYEEEKKEAIRAKLMQRMKEEEEKEIVDNAFKDDGE